MIRGCIGPRELRAQRGGTLLINIAKRVKADALNPGKAGCMDLSHAAATDDGYPKGGRHCQLLVKWGMSRAPALRRRDRFPPI
jgi:hypothetical protein